MSKSTKDYNKINWSEHFYVDSSSRSGLRWNRDVIHGTGKGYIRFHKGSGVGHMVVNKNKEPTAWGTRLNGIIYLVHRIVWCLTYRNIDNSLVIDHINGNPLDNTIENLKLTTQKENSQNFKQNKLNSSGVNGVCMSYNNNVLIYVATWKELNGKPNTKSFSTNKYGSEEAFRLACEYRAAQIALLNINGANYTSRHGSA